MLNITFIALFMLSMDSEIKLIFLSTYLQNLSMYKSIFVKSQFAEMSDIYHWRSKEWTY